MPNPLWRRRHAVFAPLLLLLTIWLVTPLLYAQSADPLPPLIFVARNHLATQDTIFEDELGPAGQFGTGMFKFAPGSKLVRRNADGSLFVYNTPGLVDVQSPDVSFDGSRLVFAGATTLIPDTLNSGWRLYEINVDGSGFRQLTFSDRTLTIPNAGQFLTQEEYGTYSDLFPAYLADGRIVFSSSRYPARSHYDARRTFNLYLINADGSGLHRISSERAMLLHPTPLPDGRILTARWWNQFNQPTATGIYNRIDNADTDQTLPDGTVILANPNKKFDPARGILPSGHPIRIGPNTWHLMTLNPDGTGFKRFVWTPVARWALDIDSGEDDTYHAAQPALVFKDSVTYVAYTSQQDSSMVHTTLETGIRVARPGVAMIYANATDAIAGLTYLKAWEQGDRSPPYALHPWGLPDGRILFSQTRQDDSLPRTGQQTEGGHLVKLQGSNLRYELYVMDLNGANQTSVAVDLNSIGLPTFDVMDAKPVVARTGWTARPDAFTAVASDDPRLGNIPNTLPEYAFSLRGANEIQTATLHNPNIYANPSLYTPFVNNSPPPGSIDKVQLWIDANQFTGAHCYNDYPQPCATFRSDEEVRAVLWAEAPVTRQGAFTITAPADTPGFFVLRDADGQAVSGWNRGYISIAQGNAWGRPGETVTCTGCHMGHVSGSLDDVLVEAQQGWTNIAPYATVGASNYYAYVDPQHSDYQPFRPQYLNDRRGWIPLPAGGPPAPFFVNTTALRALFQPTSLLPPQARRAVTAPYQDDLSSWVTEKGKAVGEWVELRWPTALLMRSVRLVGPPPQGGDWEGFGEPAQDGPYHVESGLLQFFRAGQQVGEVVVGRVEPLETGGTVVRLATPLEADQVRFTVNAISGRWWWEQVAALNEVEVMGMAAGVWPKTEVQKVFVPLMRR